MHTSSIREDDNAAELAAAYGALAAAQVDAVTLRATAKNLYNLVFAGTEIIVRAPTKTKRDAIMEASEQLRHALLQSPEYLASLAVPTLPVLGVPEVKAHLKP